MLSEIPFIRPSAPSPDELADDFAEITNANWYTNFGPKERSFAQAVGAYLGEGLHVATFANGTLALLAALQVTFGFGNRDRYLLMPGFTFVASSQAAVWAGYRPWFVDIDPDTWQPSADSARAVLERSRDRIAGVLLANTFGVGNPRIGRWRELADEWELPMVIDSAAGFGSAYPDGERVGGQGDCEIFSFHATKPFMTGEGGALVSRDADRVERARRFQNYGFADGGCVEFGLNGKLNEISAAIGLRQLVGLDERLASRRDVFKRYCADLSGSGLSFQPNVEASSVCFASARCDSPEHKSAVLAALQDNAIRAHDYYNPPQHRQPYFQANPELVRMTDLSVTEHLCSRIVSLPVHNYMAADDVARVIATVQEVEITR